MLIGVSMFQLTYGGIQIQALNHIKNSSYDYIIYADASGQMEDSFKSLKNVKKIVYCKDKEIPDLVKRDGCNVFLHHTVNHTDRSSILALKSNGIPVVVFHHCAWKPVYNSVNVSKMITTSNSNINIIQQNQSFKNKEIHKVHLSLDTKKYDKILNKSNSVVIKQKYGIPLSATIIGRIGRLETGKCPEDFIRVAGALKSNYSKRLFFIVGGMLSTYETDQYIDKLKKLAKDSGLIEKKDIIFTGDLTIEEKIELLSIFDIFLYPTKWEGYCIAFLEAMYCSKPVVTYDNLANAETVSNCGLLTSTGDLDGLERNTILLLKSPEIGKILGSNGKNLVTERNSIAIYVKRVDDLIESATSIKGINMSDRIISKVEVKDKPKNILNICQIGWGLVDNMESSPEHLQIVHMKRAGQNVQFFCVTQKGASEIEGVKINRVTKFDENMITGTPDVVHIHHVENHLSMPAALWAYKNRIPVVMNIHSIHNDPYDFVGLVDKFVVFSDKEMDLRISQRVPRSKLVIIPNGIDIGRYNSNTMVFHKGKYNILFVGQFLEFKGIYSFVDIAKKFITDNPKMNGMFHMATHVIGELDKLKNYINKSDMEGYIKLYPSKHGERKFQDLIDMYNSCDVFVLPTKMDCFPTTILEAMACSKPVIATTVGGIANMIDHEITGYHIQERTPYAVGSCVRALVSLNNIDKRTDMGRHGYNKVMRNHNITNTTQEYLNLYRGII
jgi:glycosyltransferase involved in cell wall biosynthesis